MNRLWIVCLWIVISLVCTHLHGQENKRPIIVLDPGHGGVDSGAIGVNDIMEKDIVLEVVMEAIRLNRELFGNRLDIYLTRYTDTLISLNDRTRLVKVMKPDVFISIHCNQAARKSAQGIEVYVKQLKTNTNSFLRSKSETLADALLSECDQGLGFKIRGMKYANFQVLRETQNICPGVLLELGFLSNWEEAEHSGRRESISGFALGLLMALRKVIM